MGEKLRAWEWERAGGTTSSEERPGISILPAGHCLQKTYSVVKIIYVKEIITLEAKNCLETASVSKAFLLKESL